MNKTVFILLITLSLYFIADQIFSASEAYRTRDSFASLNAEVVKLNELYNKQKQFEECSEALREAESENQALAQDINLGWRMFDQLCEKHEQECEMMESYGD